MHELVTLMDGVLTWSLTFNDHKGLYQSIGEWAEIAEINADADELADIRACVEAGNVWHLQVYPRTPVGSYSFYAPTFEALLERARILAKQIAHEIRD